MNHQNLLSITRNLVHPPISSGLVLLSARELDKMRRVGQLAANLLNHLESMVQPGVSTQALNDEATRWMEDHGAISATLGYAPPGYPPFTGAICTSINEVVCHGIPNPKQILKDGDIINIDVTLRLAGYHGDTSRTFLVGSVSATARKLVEATQESMMRGIAEIKPGARIGDIGAAIQAYAEASGFSVVRDMVGHGIGRQMHTELQIPHYGKRGSGLKLRPGMVFTVEPMLNEGTYELTFLADGWTVITKDKKLSAQFEHTVVVTEEGVEILTLA
ncbi:methionine aminopeptidase [Synechocystis sp. PCC 6803]|uniref:Methionine aminopeptidase B n=1 Tax=Synechocystis sp. (strain ATCC 27184 / PCC 6803 / Kazusa) TaxID=1111708 RepID=MAP12_SYNY3|nr:MULTISPECIES: type I methionyl aminopeptidase [unclassified Synechocystis]P53580.1 RecName: Full=Methionine aminopeptidase B; Short=MAP B; Short=MetAP B; AltName: Full=Peptidase M [Synechocystis sp. PCC 6803 substr. Kazusa]MBD2618802.1 type I methionyl aminopeptidase [Synechocystis sp. FACHB-898]MBD2640673.1 type I methionyl aminopeptidase [Synechocystis sp. FACHB-908]MBD2661475.1 type I methionyl aminopeptidase [Synechocystis sp. FACHB-929]BAM53709.1 methionine aminopeptidase [Synechocysti